jgi:hypothetical protein
MRRLAKAALIVRLRDELDRYGSWCGETHVQKASYFLQDAVGVPLGFDFVLYRHGPFAFDLREELIALRAEGLLSLQPQSPYGPRLVSTPQGERLLAQFPKTVGRYESQVNQVAKFVRDRGVSDLERIATALMLIREDPDHNDADLASRMVDLKPHIKYDAAVVALGEVRQFLNAVEQPA